MLIWISPKERWLHFSGRKIQKRTHSVHSPPACGYHLPNKTYLPKSQGCRNLYPSVPYSPFLKLYPHLLSWYGNQSNLKYSCFIFPTKDSFYNKTPYLLLELACLSPTLIILWGESWFFLLESVIPSVAQKSEQYYMLIYNWWCSA